MPRKTDRGPVLTGVMYNHVILVYKVVLPLDNQKQRHTIALTINTDNYYSLFLIPWLNCLVSATLVCLSNNYSRADNTYYKACLVKVIEVRVYNPIFCSYILYKLEPHT
jgi:hypothetical protein